MSNKPFKENHPASVGGSEGFIFQALLANRLAAALPDINVRENEKARTALSLYIAPTQMDIPSIASQTKMLQIIDSELPRIKSDMKAFQTTQDNLHKNEVLVQEQTQQFSKRFISEFIAKRDAIFQQLRKLNIFGKVSSLTHERTYADQLNEVSKDLKNVEYDQGKVANSVAEFAANVNQQAGKFTHVSNIDIHAAANRPAQPSIETPKNV